MFCIWFKVKKVGFFTVFFSFYYILNCAPFRLSKSNWKKKKWMNLPEAFLHHYLNSEPQEWSSSFMEARQKPVFATGAAAAHSDQTGFCRSEWKQLL